MSFIFEMFYNYLQIFPIKFTNQQHKSAVNDIMFEYNDYIFLCMNFKLHFIRHTKSLYRIVML